MDNCGHFRGRGLVFRGQPENQPAIQKRDGFDLTPDHFDVLITPAASLELAVQCLKGSFSFRAKRELGWKGEVWVAGFSDHRIRDGSDFDTHLAYIGRNPVKARLVEFAAQYAYSSANGQFEVDAFPRGLKPQVNLVSSGAAKAAPFQSKDNNGDAAASQMKSE